MPTVTVDTDDLEALLFATSGIKDIEAALDQRKRNPMVKAGLGKLEGAHDRLSAAWRRAKRDVDWPKRVVTELDQERLRSLFTAEDGSIKPFVVLNEYPTYYAQKLLLVEAGPLWEGFQIEWPAPGGPEFHMRPTGAIRYGARLTHYGRQVLGVTESEISKPTGQIGFTAVPLIGRVT